MTDVNNVVPATGSRAKLLDELLRMAKELPKIIELERSGVRDGNGCWQGSDALGGTIENLHKGCQELAGPVLDELGTLVWVPQDGPSETFQNVEPRTLFFQFWEAIPRGWVKTRYGNGGILEPDDEIPF